MKASISRFRPRGKSSLVAPPRTLPAVVEDLSGLVVVFLAARQAVHRDVDQLIERDALRLDEFARSALQSSQFPHWSFRTAARFADQHVLGLRAGDALHLAICADHGATLCTLDRRLANAGSALGVKAMLL
jgi:predicted nucleic acid-binding protein